MAPVRNDVAVGRIAWGRHVKKKRGRGLSNANGAVELPLLNRTLYILQ